jgi:hypothetical protein
MGRMTCSSTLQIPHPRNHHSAPGSITWLSLSGKSYFPAHIGTQISMLPPHMTFYLHPETPGKPAPRSSGTLGSHWLMGNRNHKPAGSIPPEATPQNWAPWSPCRKLGLGTPAAFRACSPEPASHWTAFPEAQTGYQAPRLLLPKGLVPPPPCL